MYKIVLLSIYFYTSFVYARDLHCEQYMAVTCNQKNIHTYLAKREWIDKHMDIRESLNKAELDEYAPFIRFLKREPDYFDSQKQQDKLNDLKIQFLYLQSLNEAISETNNLLNLVHDSPSWRVDLEKDLKYLYDQKFLTLSNYPIFLSDGFNKLLQRSSGVDLSKKAEILKNENKKDNNDENQSKNQNANQNANQNENKDKRIPYKDKLSELLKEVGITDREFRSVATDSAIEAYKALQLSFEFKNKVRAAFLNNDYDNTALSVFLNGLELDHEIYNSDSPHILCETFQKSLDAREKYEDEKAITDMFILVSPFLVGGSVKAGSYTTNMLKLANAGFKTRVFNATNVTSFASSAYFFKDTMIGISDVTERCQKIARDLYTDKKPELYHTLKTCQKDYAYEIGMLAFSGGVSAITSTRAFNRILEIRQNMKNGFKLLETDDHDKFFNHIRYIDFMSSDFTHTGIKLTRKKDEIIVVNLANTEYGSPIDAMAVDYWNYVGEVYQKRLKLSDEEVKSFVQSSNDMAERTLLVVNRNLDPSMPGKKFNGGVALVQADADSILPLEKALKFRLPRGNKKVAEIVRLTADKSKEANYFKELLSVLTQVARAGRDVEEFYIYTSKEHYRLYSRIFKNHEIVKDTGRDKVIKLTRADMIEATKELY